MDVFARVCEVLRENDFARLRRCANRWEPDRPLSTFLFTVVHNITVDWFRHRDGRPRLSAVAAALPPLQQRIFEYVFVDGRSHVEAYELLRARDAPDLAFGEFLSELSATYRTVRSGRRGGLAAELAVPPPSLPDAPPDPAIAAEQRALLARAMDALDPDDRLAVQLYVVDEMPADQVARALGYPNPKTVYNRIYRALGAIRSHLAQAGIRGGDL
jgi:RNA polymerase sigma factor (sigma-70 family)